MKSIGKINIPQEAFIEVLTWQSRLAVILANVQEISFPCGLILDVRAGLHVERRFAMKTILSITFPVTILVLSPLGRPVMASDDS
jgi:hypothetical protein